MTQEKGQSDTHVARVYRCFDCGARRVAHRNEVCGVCKEKAKREDDELQFALESLQDGQSE